MIPIARSECSRSRTRRSLIEGGARQTGAERASTGEARRGPTVGEARANKLNSTAGTDGLSSAQAACPTARGREGQIGRARVSWAARTPRLGLPLADERSGGRRGPDGVDRRRRPVPVVRTGPAGSGRRAAELQGIELGRLSPDGISRPTRGLDDYVFPTYSVGGDWPEAASRLGVRPRVAAPTRKSAGPWPGYERYTITPFGASQGLAGDRRRVEGHRRTGRSSPSAAGRAASTSTSPRRTWVPQAGRAAWWWEA